MTGQRTPPRHPCSMPVRDDLTRRVEAEPYLRCKYGTIRPLSVTNFTTGGAITSPPTPQPGRETDMQLTTDDLAAALYRADLHARCDWWKRRRFRECDWQPSGYCRNCGRPQPTLTFTETGPST